MFSVQRSWGKILTTRSFVRRLGLLLISLVCLKAFRNLPRRRKLGGTPLQWTRLEFSRSNGYFPWQLTFKESCHWAGVSKGSSFDGFYLSPSPIQLQVSIARATLTPLRSTTSPNMMPIGILKPPSPLISGECRGHLRPHFLYLVEADPTYWEQLWAVPFLSGRLIWKVTFCLA